VYCFVKLYLKPIRSAVLPGRAADLIGLVPPKWER